MKADLSAFDPVTYDFPQSDVPKESDVFMLPCRLHFADGKVSGLRFDPENVRYAVTVVQGHHDKTNEPMFAFDISPRVI